MNIHIKLFTSILFLVFIPLLSFTQDGLVKGRITDDQTSEALPFVNIGVKDTSIGTYTNEEGYFRLSLPPGTYTLVISYVGYQKEEQPVHIEAKKESIVNFSLKAFTQELNTVVISGSKYEQRLQESIASIEVLKPNLITANNPSSIDKAIDKVPGITIIDNEPQIRGGSGFSSGLGSRVMIMVDDIPVLTGNAGRPNWGFLPVDDVEQIEVVKGASSVVYGSSAITGAINIRTAYPKDKPSTKVNIFAGMYNKPSVRYATPWEGFNPMIYGFSISHLQAFGNIDVGAGATYYNDQGYIRGAPKRQSDSLLNLPSVDTLFNKGEFEQRMKVYFNTRVRNQKIEGLTYGLNGNFMYSDNAQTYFWYDADTNIYRSFPGSDSHFQEFSFYVDPYVKYFNKNGNSHSLKNRIYYGHTNATNNQSSMFVTVYDEYAYTHRFKKLGDLMVVAGVMNTYSYSYGQVFSGQLSAEGTTTSTAAEAYESENFAAYLQLEKKFFDRLNVLVGARWEYYQIANFYQSKPILRAGLNMQAAKNTYIRVSAGQGYRAPSIGERYITTNSGNFGFYPNPALTSETSTSYEIGAKQMFHLGKFAMMADLSGFLEYYQNYVEMNFGIWGQDVISKSLGFKFLNVGPTRIYGIDATLGGEGKLSRSLDLSVLIGYTWSVPEATEPNLVYYTNYESQTGKTREYTYLNSSTDTTGHIMKYRIENLFKSDIQVTFKKRISAGITGRYYGYMKNIDIFLYQLEPAMHSGIKQYREAHDKGNFIVDFRVSYMVKSFTFAFLVNNLMNTQYSLRPMTIESPRTTSFQVRFTI
jgi:outer membrane cobalamin receptor